VNIQEKLSYNLRSPENMRPQLRVELKNFPSYTWLLPMDKKFLNYMSIAYTADYLAILVACSNSHLESSEK